MPDPSTSTAATSTDETVTVRMYRQMLGDCFLLTHEFGGKTFCALIDCGVLQCIGASKPETLKAFNHIGSVVTDLKASLPKDGDGKPFIDLVIATHEHFDHLSGFIVGFADWNDIQIGAVWMAWTENDNDDEAKAFKTKNRAAIEALRAAQRLSPFAATASAEAAKSTLDGMLQFAGNEADLPPTPPKTPRSCAAVLDWLKQRVAGKGAVRFLEPGDVVEFGVAGRLTANVLGPPRNVDLLKQLDPSTSTPDTYLTKPDDVAALIGALKAVQPSLGLLLAAPLANGTPLTADSETPFPSRFDLSGRPQLKVPSQGPPLKLDDFQQSGLSTAGLYLDPAEKERRIDGEWLGTAATLALKIDGDVNNTSLALAIEMKGGDILLFPADAQVGNWLSWSKQSYPKKPPTPQAPVKTIGDIFGRVVFYKVGHHCSHNATMKEAGLERMTSPDLVAMIPVVEAVAAEQKSKTNPQGWSMPFPNLYASLKLKTKGRIVRGDGDMQAETQAFDGSPAALRYGGGQGADLWAELTFQCDRAGSQP